MAMNGDEAADMLSASLDHPELTTMIVPAPTSIWGDRAILRVLGNGALGDLRTMRLTWGGSVSGGAADPWRRQKRFSGSNMMAAGTQYECISRWLANALSMQARTERYETAERRIDGIDVLDAPDCVAIQAEFPARVHATIEIPAHTGNGGANQVLLFGSDATLQVDFDAKTLALAKRGSTDFAAVEIRPDERQGLARGSRVHRCDPWHGGGPPDGLRNRRPLHVVHGRSQPIGRIGAANAFVGSRKSETSIAGLRWTRQTAFVEEWRS